MRILINQKHGVKLYLALPTSLLASRLGKHIVRQAVSSAFKKRTIKIEEETLVRFIDEIIRQKKKHRRLELLEVHAKDGTTVKFRL